MPALRVVVPHNGPMICGVMMKTTMLIATMTVELVALMKTKDGIITAMYVIFLPLIFFMDHIVFNTCIGL